MAIRKGLFQAEDGALRCGWCQASPAYRDYHDREWVSFPVTRSIAVSSRSCFPASRAFRPASAGSTILNKREAFRRAFANFDAARAVARFGERDVTRLLADAGIVRHRGKIESTIGSTGVWHRQRKLPPR